MIFVIFRKLEGVNRNKSKKAKQRKGIENCKNQTIEKNRATPKTIKTFRVENDIKK